MTRRFDALIAAPLAWRRLLLAAITAVLLGAGTASAATLTNVETRVGASTPAASVVVGSHASVSAGQRWGHAPPQAEAMVGRGVAANTADDVGGMIYRTGSRTDNALTDASGVSFRDSVSSSLSSQHPQVFRPGDKVWAVDTSRLPPGAAVRDGVPPGHVSVNATPGQIRDAIVDDPFLGGLGLKPLDEFGSYRLPR